MNLQELITKAGEMAKRNIWGENAQKINMAILKLDQNNSAAYTRLAKYYRLQDNIIEAKNMYLKALEIDPQSRGALNNLSDIDREEKENSFVEQIKTVGEMFRIGQTSAQKGKYELAIKLFSKANSVEPQLKFAASLAGVYKKMGRSSDVEKLYLQLLESNKIDSDIEAIKTEFIALGISV